MTTMSCPVCLKKKPAADEHGHCSYACASGGGSAAPRGRKSLVITSLADGRIQLSGATYPVHDQIKARGGRWNPAERVWVLPAGSDTTFVAPVVAPPAAPPAAPLFVRRDRLGRCCSAAVGRIDAENPCGPMWFDCKVHGSVKSNYTGD